MGKIFTIWVLRLLYNKQFRGLRKKKNYACDITYATNNELGLTI